MLMPLGDGSHDYSAGDGTLKCVWMGCWKDSKLWGGPKELIRTENVPIILRLTNFNNFITILAVISDSRSGLTKASLR